MFLLICLVLNFFLVSLFGYLTHRALHHQLMGRFYHSHMVHHMELYPPNNFRSEMYRDAGKHSTFWFFLFAGIPILLLPAALFLIGKISLIGLGILFIESVLLGLANNYLHDLYHLNNKWLNKIPYFTKLVSLHYQHHIEMKTNFGIFWFFFDRLFGTFKEFKGELPRQIK